MQYIHPCLTLDFTSHQACSSHQVLLVVGGLRGSGATSTLCEEACLADSIIRPLMKICSAMSARIPHLLYLSFPFVGQLPLLFSLIYYASGESESMCGDFSVSCEISFRLRSLFQSLATLQFTSIYNKWTSGVE